MVKAYSGGDFPDNAVVRFHADWCQPCKAYAPQYEKLSEEFSDIPFYDVNIELHPRLTAGFGVKSIPAVFLIRDGAISKSDKELSELR